VDTAWIELNGERIELIDMPAVAEVSVEALTEEDPAVRYLWRRLAVSRHFHEPPENVEASSKALVAASAIRGNDPVLQDIRAVASALSYDGARAKRALPEPWSSLLGRRGREDGPPGTVVIAAVTPPIDGFVVAVSGLESTETSFEIEVEVTPGLDSGGPFDLNVEAAELEWWAADDLGNRYLGSINSWSGGDDHAEGQIAFFPPIDPKASRIDLMPTADTARGVIRVPLPWAGEETP
jgi:hypothetical protein